MDRERPKKGKVEEFVNNKVARATAAVALTFAAGAAVEKGLGYDVLPNVERAEAQTPPNSSFEVPDTSDPTLPEYWGRQFSSLNSIAFYHYGDYVAHTGSSSIEGRYVGYDDGSGCTRATNGWDSPLISITDTNKKYSERFFAAYSQDATTTVLPQVTTYFYDSSDNPIGSPDDAVYSVGLSQNTWELKVRTFGPGGEVPWPLGTAKIKMRFLENATSTTPCVDGAVFGYVRYDDVSLIDVTQTAVGGVAEVSDLSKLPALSATEENDSKEIPVLIGGIVVGALVIGAGGYAVRSIKRQKSA